MHWHECAADAALLARPAHGDCHSDLMHTRSEPVDTAGAEQDAAGSRQTPRRDLARPAGAHQRRAADEAAAAAAFERLKARLRQLVGTNKA